MGAGKGLLDVLAAEIDSCRLCDRHFPVEHSKRMVRGTGRFGIVVGIQPGKTEIATGVAFSGTGGRRLIDWLVKAQCGANRLEVFDRLYFTSLAKCLCETNYLRMAVRNCRPFLTRQIDEIKPRLLITLGALPLELLFDLSPLDDWVGKAFRETEVRPTLFPLLSDDCIVIPLPHPSFANRWLNDARNQAKVDGALALISQIFVEKA